MPHALRMLNAQKERLQNFTSRSSEPPVVSFANRRGAAPLSHTSQSSAMSLQQLQPEVVEERKSYFAAQAGDGQNNAKEWKAGDGGSVTSAEASVSFTAADVDAALDWGGEPRQMRLQERNSEHMYLFSLHRNQSASAPASAGHFLQWTPVGNPREVAGYVQLCDVARACQLAPFKVLVQVSFLASWLPCLLHTTNCQQR